MLPEIAHQPMVHNPFPQLSKIAVAPFFNLSAEPTVDGRRFALAYYNALQSVPGYEVVPVGVVERAMKDYSISLSSPQEARRLAQLLGVDVLVIGAVTDYTPYYPPRCGLQVEWYAANPCFHPIPPGYGLPWGTPEEEHIPGPLVFEAEMALAKAQLKTQTPDFQPAPLESIEPARSPDDAPSSSGASEDDRNRGGAPDERVVPLSHQQLLGTTDATGATGSSAVIETNAMGLPEDWPDPRGFIPPPPRQRPPTCWPTDAPVMRHTAIYNGNDASFTEALSSYYYFQDEARFGGWQTYLERSDDFIRFCCTMHISEMLSARGGAGETRVVWRWPKSR